MTYPVRWNRERIGGMSAQHEMDEKKKKRMKDEGERQREREGKGRSGRGGRGHWMMGCHHAKAHWSLATTNESLILYGVYYRQIHI